MDIAQRIKELVASNPGQMTEPEYGAIAEELQARGPCSLLVFGLGRDTPLWKAVNQKGRTAFLEHDPRWVRFQDWPVGGPQVHLVEYTTKIAQTEEYKQAVPSLAIPPGLRLVAWDVIVVDAPPGQTPNCPGRFQSIYEASRLAAPDAAVFVHDIDRPVEKWFSTRFLGKPIETVHRLGVFGTKAKRPRR